MKKAVAFAALAALLVSACAPAPRVAEPSAPASQAPAAAHVPAAVPPAAPEAIERYKSLVASEIWLRNAEVYSDPVPEMLKSIVVLEITIDRVGNPVDISVYRSNGFKVLEARALQSVVRAAPFPAPAAGVLEGPGSVTFLETFLFRADGRFQLRSLAVPAVARR